MAGDVTVSVQSALLAASTTGTTDFTKTDFGTPKACLIIVTSDDNDGTTPFAQDMVSIGFSDFTNDYCLVHQNEDAQTKVDADAMRSNTFSYHIFDNGGTVLKEGTAGTITDGVRLTNSAGSSQMYATVVMFGGADLAVDTAESAVNATVNLTADISHTGMVDGNDKLAFFLASDITSPDNASTGAENSFGVCHITGSDSGGWTFVQRCMGQSIDHNNTNAIMHAVVTTDRVIDIITEAGVQDWGIEITAFSNSGGTMTMTSRDVGPGSNMEIFSLILDLDNKKGAVGNVDSNASNNASYTGDGATDLDFLVTADTITRTTGSWIDDGYKVGTNISITGSVSNNGSTSVTGVADLVLSTGGALTTETNVAATVSQNNADPGDWVVDESLGFTPQYVGLILSGIDAGSEDTILYNTNPTGSTGAWGISSVAGSGEETCHSWYDQTAVGTTNTNTMFKSQAIYFLRHDAGATFRWNISSFTSFDSGGWTYDNPSVDQRILAMTYIYWTIEGASAPAVGQPIKKYPMRHMLIR